MKKHASGNIYLSCVSFTEKYTNFHRSIHPSINVSIPIVADCSCTTRDALLRLFICAVLTRQTRNTYTICSEHYERSSTTKKKFDYVTLLTLTDTTMLWVYYKYNEKYMPNWDIVGLHLRINYTMNILYLFWFILLINISLHISLNALILARPRVTLHKNACNHFYILYICDVADASNPTNLKFVKWKCRGCNRKYNGIGNVIS